MDINGSLLQNIFGPSRDRAMVGFCLSTRWSGTRRFSFNIRNVGTSKTVPATTLQNVATGAGIGDVNIPGSVNDEFSLK